MTRFSEVIEGVVAIDGKVLRRSFDRSCKRQIAFAHGRRLGCQQRLVLAQIATDTKSNEITAVPKLLAIPRATPRPTRNHGALPAHPPCYQIVIDVAPRCWVTISWPSAASSFLRLH